MDYAVLHACSSNLEDIWQRHQQPDLRGITSHVKTCQKNIRVGFKRDPEDSQRSVKVITFLTQEATRKKAQRKEGVEKQKE